jgi:hypothetical protein
MASLGKQKHHYRKQRASDRKDQVKNGGQRDQQQVQKRLVAESQKIIASIGGQQCPLRH